MHKDTGNGLECYTDGTHASCIGKTSQLARQIPKRAATATEEPVATTKKATATDSVPLPTAARSLLSSLLWFFRRGNARFFQCVPFLLGPGDCRVLCPVLFLPRSSLCPVSALAPGCVTSRIWVW